MKLTSKILLGIAFVLAIAFFVQISAVNAAFVFWEDRAEIEERQIGADLHTLNRAYEHYLSLVSEADALKTGEARSAIARLEEERTILKVYDQEATAALAQITEALADLKAVITDVTKRVPAAYKGVVENLQSALENRTAKKKEHFGNIARLKEEVAAVRANYAVEYEKYLVLEYNQFLQQEELERRKEIVYRYRFLRPDLQRETGDNGPFIQADVISADRESLTINKGARDGVELYQKFSVMRGDRVIAVADVVLVQNYTAEARVIALPREDLGLVPQAGDTVIPQRGILPLGKSNADIPSSADAVPATTQE